jgi:glutamate/tyrosine decarboxylase-like PLP-dependent enzyme
MQVARLKELIAGDLANDLVPVVIVATAGTTVAGAFDPIREIAEVAAQHGIWLHVDGAFGGSVLLSGEHRHLLDGSELSDSFTWNPHKMMGVPLPCSAVLLRQKGLLNKNLSETAEYLFQEDDDELNPGTRSIQCGRRNNALKLWAAWQLHGDDGYEARVHRQFWLAHRATEMIQADPELQLSIEPQSVNVCFEVKGKSSAAICHYLDVEARLKVGHGVVNGRSALRLVCVNPDLTEADLRLALDEIKAVAAKLPPADNTVT